MNRFVAGVHGVGKTFLASQLPATIGLTHTSASKLIKDELEMANWGADKRVANVDTNQIALAAAVKRLNDAGKRLLLDGHFVLLSSDGKFTALGTEVFRPLNLDGVLLLEADPNVIADRIRVRDGRETRMEDIVQFIDLERSQAQIVCAELGIALHILYEPTSEIFAEAIATMTGTGR